MNLGRKWLENAENRRFSVKDAPILGVFDDFGAQNRFFWGVLVATSPLCESVGVLDVTPDLLNVSVLGSQRLVAGTHPPLVQLLFSGC